MFTHKSATDRKCSTFSVSAIFTTDQNIKFADLIILVAGQSLSIKLPHNTRLLKMNFINIYSNHPK